MLQASSSDREETGVSRRDYRFIFPEFLPDPDPNFRNSVAERLQRQDMIARREVVEIPGETSMMKLNQFLNTEF